MKQKKSRKPLWIILGILLVVFLSLGMIGGVKYREDQAQIKREHKLYKRGFRLLEEQIAIYTKEHYEGVSKIEFSPIFEDGRDGYSMYTLQIVPIIYDTYGHGAMMGTQIGRHQYNSYRLGDQIDMGFDGGDGSEYIVLKDLDTGKEIDVSHQQHIPASAKLASNSRLDKNIEAVVNDGQLKGVKKSDKGSPEAKVTYNTEIREGDYEEWR